MTKDAVEPVRAYLDPEPPVVTFQTAPLASATHRFAILSGVRGVVAGVDGAVSEGHQAAMTVISAGPPVTEVVLVLPPWAKIEPAAVTYAAAKYQV